MKLILTLDEVKRAIAQYASTQIGMVILPDDIAIESRTEAAYGGDRIVFDGASVEYPANEALEPLNRLRKEIGDEACAKFIKDTIHEAMKALVG